MKYDGITVDVGTASSISVSRTFYDGLPAPYSSCRDDLTVTSKDSLYYNITSSLTQYYQKFCYEICFQYEYAIKYCGCADPSIPAYDANVTICKNITCIDDYRKKFDSESISAICDSYCPVECDSITYDTVISVSSYPSTYYSSILTTQSDISTKFTVKNSFSPSSSSGPPPPGRKRRELTDESDETVNKKLDRKKRSGSTSGGSSGSSGGSGGSGGTSVSQTNIQESVAMFTVYYQEMRYTSIEESASITLDTLTGVVGGQVILLIFFLIHKDF